MRVGGQATSEDAADASEVDGERGRVGLRHELEPIVRMVSATVIIGAGLGALIGGIGGRIAMRILFATSDDRVKGVTSDDGFEIGRFTLASTIGLVVLTALIGVLAALLYLVARPFVLPLGAAVVPAMAALYGVLGGAMMVHRDGVDFNTLEPAALAIGLFVAICAGFGAAVSSLTNAAVADGGWAARRSWWLLGPPVLLALLPPFVVVVCFAGTCNWLASVRNRPVWLWRVVDWSAVAVIAGLFSFGAVDLARDSAALDLNIRSRGSGLLTARDLVVPLDGEHRELGLVRRAAFGRQRVRTIADELRRRAHGVVQRAIGNRRVAEPPAPHARRDRSLAGTGRFDAGRGEDTAVVTATRTGAVLVDRARAVDEHRAMAALVVAEHDVPARQERRGEQEFGRDVRERVGLFRPDVHELRRGAARRTAVARNARVVLAADRALHLVQPRREVTGRQLGIVVHLLQGSRVRQAQVEGFGSDA